VNNFKRGYNDLFLLLIVLLFLGIPVLIYKLMKKRKLKRIVIPLNLGYREDIPLGKRVVSLETAFHQSYEQKIKQRFLVEHPKTTEHEFELLLFELKRFFIMCSLMQHVPMFSRKVDDVWHEMILFTREYQSFSHEFCGEFIHHSPTEKKEPDPHGRAWFDLVYTLLFEFTPYTQLAWGRFFKNPLSQTLIEEIRTSTWGELKSKYFRKGVDDEVAIAIIQKLKWVIENALEYKDFKKDVPPSNQLSKYTTFLAGAMVFYSMYHADHYRRKMNAILHGSFNFSSNCSSGWSNNCSNGCSNNGFNGCSNNCSNSCSGSCSSGSGCSSCGGN
jgi:hypothetical protein